MASDDAGTAFLANALDVLRSQKRQAEKAIAQLDDEQLHVALDGNTNSIVLIMKHIAGNMLSRWTDLLTTDGEKPWRNRDTEFVDDFTSREQLLARWEEGWTKAFETISSLTPEDLSKTVTIRGHERTAMREILGAVSHYGYHIGQIILLSCHLAGENWQWLTIRPGESEQFNERTWEK